LARRTFEVIDIVEILIHWYAGRSKNELATSLGVDRKTLRKYLAPAEAAGICPGGPPMAEADWRKLVVEWFPQLADTRLRQVSWPVIEVHRDYIAAQLKAGVTAATIHQRLVDERGLEASVASLRRWIRANLPEDARRAAVTVLRDTPPPGAEAQIDYGRLGMWLDPKTGKRRTVWAFVMVLAHSRHMFVRPTLGMDQHEWTAAHVEAFEFFGGCPGRLVPDNLKTGVDKPDLYDPKINRSYAELAAHYGVLVDPARALKPKDKPRVERPMPYVRDSFWRGREFTSLEQMRAAAIDWCRDVAGARACRPLDGATPAAVFAAGEAEALRPLPTGRFVLATWTRAKVGPDIHASVAGCLYSIPWRHLGVTVDARSTATMVQFFVDGELVKTHPRKPRGKQTDLGDYPPEKIAFHMRTPAWCRRKAAEIGEACQAVIAELLAENALFRLRAAQGVLGLADKHDPARLEAACGKAIAAGDPSYRTIKGILAAGLEHTEHARPTGDAGAAAHLHGPSRLFADVIAMPTTTDTDAVTTATGTTATSGGQHPVRPQNPSHTSESDATGAAS
jgi:transposase